MSNIKHNIKKATLRGSSFKSNIDTPSISIISTLYNKYRYQSIVKLGNNYGPYTTAWYTQVLANGGTATATELAALTTFETAVGSDMAEFDRLWIHGVSNSIAARVSFVNPSSTLITAVNSPTHTANLGYQGNGTTSYLNTNFTPSVNGVKYTRNSASIYIYSMTNSDALMCEIGNQLGANYSYIIPRTIGVFIGTINSNNDTNTAISDSLGLFSVKRSLSTEYDLYKNGVLQKNIAQSSVALLAQSYFILARNATGAATLFSNRQISFSAFGSGVINQSTFYTALQALGTTLGWAV